MKLARSKSRGAATERIVTTRVAVYTRQSVDRGEQELSSCDAQRATIEAFVKGHATEGWQAMPDRYDDAGFTGANTSRPGFQRLMADVRAGSIDLVAVYRIDRLSRSMQDFTATLNEFTKHGVAFVSVTQNFDTSSSTGKLMANLLGSFAEFERQQIGERIRDKLIETRRRGGWQAGHAPFGYTMAKGALWLHESEAPVVKRIFESYLALNSLSDVADALNAQGLRARKGQLWSKKLIHRVLRCKIVAGWVPYGDEHFEGKHERIIERELFEVVQAKLSRQRQHGGAKAKNKYGHLLRGLLCCAKCGRPMMNTYSRTGAKIWHYYICSSKHNAEANACVGARVPALEIERFVVERIESIGTDPNVIAVAIAATREQARARIPSLEAERRQVSDESRRIVAERDRCLAGIVMGGPAARYLGERVGEIDTQLGELERRGTAIREELLEIENLFITEAEIGAALGEFHGVWGQLIAKERARVLSLLIERIDFDGENGEVEIKYRPGGIRALGHSGGAER
jgi:site-specific DNA recombinase